MDPEFDCVICGTCVADVLVRPVPLTRAIGDGRLFAVEPIEATTGGIVCNTGMAMRRLGLRVAAASLVGDDLWGGLVRSRLEAEGIDAAGVGMAAAATSTTAVLIDPAGERSFAHHVGACAAIDPAFIRDRRGLFARGRMAILGYLGLLPGLEPDLADVVRFLAGTGCRVVLETAGSGGDLATLSPALPHVDVYVPSLDEAVRQTGCESPAEILACYRDHGAAGLVGVKLGSRGVVLSPVDGPLLEIPCVEPPGPVADTTGAGDSFLAGLLTGLTNGMSVRDAGLLGAATAACCVTGVGATAGLRSFADTWRLVRG